MTLVPAVHSHTHTALSTIVRSIQMQLILIFLIVSELCSLHKATYCTGNNVNEIAASLNSIVWLGRSLIPRPRPAFCCLQYGKARFFVHMQGEPGNASLAGLSGNQSESTHNCTFNQSGLPSLVHHSN